MSETTHDRLADWMRRYEACQPRDFAELLDDARDLLQSLGAKAPVLMSENKCVCGHTEVEHGVDGEACRTSPCRCRDFRAALTDTGEHEAQEEGAAP